MASERASSAWSPLASTIGWAVTAALALAAALHLAGSESNTVIVALAGLTPVLYLPAYPVAVLASIGHRWWLGGASGLLIVAHLWWAGTALIPWTHSPTAAGVKLRVFESNMEFTNPTQVSLGEEAVQRRADLVVLVEVQATEFAALEATMAGTYPYEQADPETNERGWAVFSRWPISAVTATEVDGWPFAAMRINVPGAQPVSLHVVHTLAPLPDILAGWKDQLHQLALQLAHAGAGTIVAGDFNATRWNPPFDSVVDTGLHDARRGHNAWTPTWPANRTLIPPMLELDHVLVSHDIIATHVAVGHADGSDHRPLIVDLVLKTSR